MIPNCGILTESIKELGKKHGITNEIYLKALYTRWATMHTNDEVFDDKALLEEMSLDAKRGDTIHLKEFGVIPSYTPISGEAPGGKISGVNKEGNIKLYKDSITGIEDFLKYISGKTSDSITSQQKKKVFEKLSKEGKDLRYFEDLLKSKKDILAFVLFHEKSHIAHRDIENYDVQDLLGDNQIEIEYRATLDAIEEFKAWKENESKKSVIKPDERFGNVTFTTTKYNDYPTRTTENANWSDITLALATDFTTAGETLTAQKAGSKDSEYLFGRKALNVKDKYVPYKLDDSSPKDIASKILETINAKGLPTKNIKLNIAGNGIYTLKETQEYYDNLITEIIRELQNLGVTIAEIRSGGQTGIDEAGIKAAQRLNIPASVHTTANWMFKTKEKATVQGNEEAFKKRFLVNTSVKNQIFDSEGNIRWDYFERILDAYHNNQPDSMFAKGRYTLATRPENHFEGEKNTLNHIKFVTQSMLDLLEGKFDVDLPFVSEARASLKNQRDLMILAAMFHDVAKPYRHGDIHGWEAADIVRDVLGVDYNNRIAEWAVRHHMPMPFSHKAEFSLANPEALEVAKNIARDAKRLGIDAQTAINAFVLINAADVINGRELSVEDNWAKKAIAESKTRYGDDISVKNVLTIELNEKVELLKQAFEEIKDEDLGDSKYNYENQERFDYIAFPEGGREDKKLPYLNNKTTQQSDELPEDIIIKPSPVSADEVTKRDLNTPRAKLNSILPDNIQKKRSKLIAKMFYDICNEHIEAKKQEYLDKGDYQTVLEWDSSAVGRAKALRYIDVKSVLEEVYQSFIDNANVTIEEMVNDWRLPLEVAEHRKKHYTIIVDNFATLLEDACPQIEKDCGLRLCITANQVDNGKIKETKLSGTFVRPEDIYDTDPNMQDNEDGARSNGNDGWSYKARHTDPHSTISLATKNILRQLPRKDSNGDIVYDDLGNEELIDEEFAHTMLIQGLSGMITSEDFCVITQTENGPEYDFPALQQLALKYPWVEEVIDYLINNPTEIAAFYTDFRNTFIPYYKFKNGKLVAMNQGTTNGSSLILQVKRDYEQGNPLTDNPIYTTMSESNIENIEINKELLKEIQDDLTYADSEDSESLKPVLEKTVKLIRALGFDVDYNDINALWHTGSNNSVFNNVLSSVSTILSKAANAEPSGLITMLNSDYIEIAKNISKVSELENLASFREGDKTYYSYSAPNFADIQIAYFKSDKYRDDYLTENFKQFKWFTDNDGNLRNGWLKLLATDDYIRQNLETIELKNIDGIDYEDWTGDMIDKAFIGAYFSKYGGDSAVKFAYYHYPIFSDSPVTKFIKMPRHSNIKEIIPLLREVVKQELYRIDHVNKRASTKGISKIGNYDKVGRKFCFFPDLNDYKVGDKSFLDACNEQYANEAKQNEIIDSALEAIMERNFLKFKQDTTITAQDLKTWGVDDLTVEESLKEYYYNSVYAETQIIQMTVTDLAYYKDATDFQKRFKEIYAAGKRLYTGSQYGKKFENVIYLADNVKTSTAYDRFKKGLNKALEAGRITKMDYDSILYKFRNVNATDAQGFRTHESYRAILDMMGQWTPVMEDALNKMIKGEWDMSHFNVVWQTIKPFLFSTTIKPDGLGDIMKVNHQNKDSEFLLLAVMDMIAADANSPQIKVLNQFMLDNNIDLALYESGCKAGKQGVIDLNYNQAKIAECKKEGSIRVGERVFNLHTDRWNPKLSNFDNFKNQLDEYLDNGTMLQEEYNKVFEEYLPLTEDEMRQVLEESVKTKESQDARFNRGERPTEDAWFNPNVVHTFSYEDYMIAQPTPEHLIDAETIFGSQFRNLIISDLPANFECTINGVKYNRKEVHDLYNSLIVANLVDSFNRLKGDFNNIHTIQQRLLSMVQGNPKYGRDIIQALEIVKVVNPLTGQEEEVFNIPLNNPSTTEKLQQLILSAFKNGITKQYIHGGNAILVSDIGYTKELNVVKEKDGTLVGIECYLPATSKAFFEPLLKTVTNTETGEAYQILDFNELDDDLKRAIGYRIPTEQKYSMVPLIIKGFLPQQNGSSIMVAEDVTTLSGCDFDVDKMFLMLYNFIFDGFGNPKKLKPRKPAIGKYKGDADAVSISKMSKEERDNLIIDLSTAILTHPDMAWVSSKPGSYDNLKRASRVAQILENDEMFEQFKKQYGVTTSAEINAKFKELPLLEDETDAEGNVITQSLENFVKEHKATMNPLELTTFKYFHRQNMTGGALVGIYANNTTMQAKYQETSLWLKEEDKLKINDTDYTSLTSIYSKDSKLISFNCAETSAASVDNGKDPVLADLMQNKKTAKVLGMLLRAGIPIDDATMVFNLPNVREVIYHTGSLDGLESRAGSLYDVLKSVLGTNLGENPSNYFNSVKNNNISSDEIIDFIIEYRNKASRIYSIIYNNELDVASKRDALIEAGFTIEEVKTFIKKDLDYSIIVNHYHTVAKDLGEVTRVSRADSPNGAIKHTIQEAVIQKRDVDLLHMGHKKTTIQGLHNVIRNDFITGDESVERMIEMFINHGTPRLQAFYTFGIDLPLNMISKYFVQTNPWMTEKTKELFDQAFVSFGSKDNGKLDPKILKYFYNGMMHYCLSSSRLFGTDSSMTFEEKRDWYIYEFPKEFINLRNKYTQLNNHSIIGRLEVRKGVIEMLRAGRLTETQRLQLSNSITSLLQGNEVERQLATDLLIYAYHSTGLNFGPNNYGMFFDTTFYNQFPEFVEILRTMQFKVNEESGLMKNFMDQFYAIYGTLFTFKVYSSKNLVINDSTRRISISKDRVVNTNIQQQKGTKEPWKYITAVYDVEEVNEAGETIKVSKRVLFKLVDGDSAENATYERIGSIYDPFTGHIRYNANRTAEQLSIDVNSEGALKKAEEQRSVNYKRGAKYEYKGRPINDRNAMDNAFAFVESDSALEVPDYFDSIPDVGDVEYGKLEASAKELDKLSLEENIANELDRDYSDDEIGIHMPDDYGTFLDGLSDVSAENLEVLEKLDEKQLSVLDNIEGYMDSIPEQDYGIEEGLNELEEKMC